MFDFLLDNSFFKKPFLTIEQSKDIIKALSTKHKISLSGKLFELFDGEVDDLLYLKVILKNEDESFYYPIITRIIKNDSQQSNYEYALIMLDYLDNYFEEYFNDEDVLLPTNWSDCGGTQINMQVAGQIYNLDLEKAANKLLEDSENLH